MPSLPAGLRALVLAGIAYSAAAAGPPPRQRLSLDAGWAFHAGDAGGAEQPAFAAEGWRRLDLPHDWSIESPVDHAAPGGGQDGFFPTGIGWYRRALTLPANWAGRRLEVEFEGVYMNADVWINGTHLGRHPYGYTSFRYDLTPFLRPGADNVLAVRVDNSLQPNSRWYSGSGIYRHVWLELTAPVRVAPWGVFVSTAELTAGAATVRVQSTTRNDSDRSQAIAVETSVLDPGGRRVAFAREEATVPPGADFTTAPSLLLAKPSPWSPEAPALYRAVTRVVLGGNTVDEVATPFGVRTLRVSADRGFELNGRTLVLVGGSAHHDNGVLGAAAFDRAEELRVELLKAAGFNAVRTAHNPPSPAFLEACDRLGLLVMEEAFDCWEKGKNPQDYSVDFKEWWRRDLDAMVRRDRNHPSVILWSIGNEVYERGVPEGARLAQMLTGRIRELDPTRPLTAGINGMGPKGDWTKTDPVFATLDVAGYNYEIARSAADHARLPSRVIVATESEPSQAFKYWSAAHAAPYVVGDFVWSALDYLGEAGIGRVFPPDEPAVRHWAADQFPWHGAACGDIDLTGWRKPLSHYRNILWDRGEKLYAVVLAPSPGDKPWNLSQWAMPPALPSWSWPGREGRPLTVEVYSRYDAVRLYLNGKLVGERPTGAAEEFKADFTMPFAPGTLQAVGLHAGRAAETFLLRTAGPAARLSLAADRTELSADGQDLSFVTVEIRDRNEVLQPNAAPEVRFTLSGPGSIAGLGTGDMTTMESYGANPHRLFQGRALVVIRAAHAGGRIGLTASAPGLPPAAISLRSLPPPAGASN